MFENGQLIGNDRKGNLSLIHVTYFGNFFLPVLSYDQVNITHNVNVTRVVISCVARKLQATQACI